MDLLKAIGRTLIVLLLIISVSVGVFVIATPIIALIICSMDYLADKLNITEMTNIQCLMIITIPLTIGLVCENYKDIKQEKNRRDK